MVQRIDSFTGLGSCHQGGVAVTRRAPGWPGSEQLLALQGYPQPPHPLSPGCQDTCRAAHHHANASSAATRVHDCQDVGMPGKQRVNDEGRCLEDMERMS